MNLRCPICRRTAWLTSKGLAEHLADDHDPRVVADELALSIAATRTAAKPTVGCRKVGYDSEHAARVELVGTVLAHNRGNRNRRECRVYLCPACHKWHLTSQEQEGKPA